MPLAWTGDAESRMLEFVEMRNECADIEES